VPRGVLVCDVLVEGNHEQVFAPSLSWRRFELKNKISLEDWSYRYQLLWQCDGFALYHQHRSFDFEGLGFHFFLKWEQE